MKSTTIFVSALFLFLIAIIYQGVVIASLQQKHQALAQSVQTLEKAASEPEHYELGKAMGYVQRFAEKLYWAGSAGNWKLAAFYIHETEEMLEEIVEHKPVKNGHDIAKLVTQMAVPSLEELEEAVKQENAVLFEQKYKVLINTCNACHAASGMNVVQVKVPQLNTYAGQRFEPVQ
jgi:cytochrome c553